MKYLAFDIETAPLPDVKERVNALYPFNPDDVAIGNRKDPVKIKEYIDEKRSSHESSLIEKAQLDPTMSYICAIGIMDIQTGEITAKYAKKASEEPDLLAWITGEMQEIRDHRIWVGFNCLKFDLEFIWKRCWITGIVPPLNFRRGRYWDDHRIKDLMVEWAFHDRNSWVSLDRLSKILGVADPDRPDDIHGKDFYLALKLSESNAFRYLASDLRETAGIARKILPMEDTNAY